MDGQVCNECRSFIKLGPGFWGRVHTRSLSLVTVYPGPPLFIWASLSAFPRPVSEVARIAVLRNAAFINTERSWNRGERERPGGPQGCKDRGAAFLSRKPMFQRKDCEDGGAKALAVRSGLRVLCSSGILDALSVKFLHRARREHRWKPAKKAVSIGRGLCLWRRLGEKPKRGFQ
jgi:hypothetical protein